MRHSGIVQVIPPTLQRRPHEFPYNIGVLLKHFARGEQHSGLDTRLMSKERFRSCECLLDILRVRDEIRYAHRCGNYVDICKLKALHNIFEPSGPRYDGYGVTIDVREGANRGVLAHHDALR